MSDIITRPEDWIRIGAAAAALGVSVDTLRRWERDGRIVFERRGQQRYLRAEELAKLLRERGREGRSSARNRLQGIVLGVRRDGVMAQIDLACGPYRVVSLMSREAADDLDLKPGDQAIAVIKSTTVVVEKR
jgi:molybdopterin-binding protein